MENHQHLRARVKASQVGHRLDKVLAKLFFEYSRSQIKAWILDDLVKVNGQIRREPKEKMLGGETVEIQVVIKETSRWKAEAIPLNIVYEDNDILVINKSRDLVVHPGAGCNTGTVLNALLHYFPPIVNVPRAGIIHRLDKDTTGLMVVAKTVSAQTRQIKSLQAQEITREYEAIAIGTMIAGGTVEEPIARHATKRTHMAVRPMGKPAVTHYRIMEHFRAHTHLRVKLETGRTHQIRVHMAHINHPLVGDPMYGGHARLLKGGSKTLKELLYNFNRQALHASRLRLYHPITSLEMEWCAPLPQDMLKLIAALKIDSKLFENSTD
ncbi:MAG: 23S rRNA pseudouridine(1911/1915/1917) synthase RluD [Sodalis sp. (in: enterobacteria)]